MPTFQVQVDRVPPSKEAMVRALRVIGKMPLATAGRLHQFLTHTPGVVVAGIGKPAAEHIVEQLRGAGAEAHVAPSSLSVPLVLEPRAANVYRWGPARSLHEQRD